MKNKKAVFITQGAVIAAIYVVLVIVFDYWTDTVQGCRSIDNTPILYTGGYTGIVYRLSHR